MIKGDIDLTEKLDFYHDKPKEKFLPALPWKKKCGVITTDREEASRWIYHYLGSNSNISIVNNDLELSWNSFDRDGYVNYNYYPTTTVNTSTNTTISISSSNSYLMFDYNTWNDEPVVTYHNATTTIPVPTNTNTWNLEISYDGQPLTFKTKLDVPEKKPLDLPYKIKPKEYTESPMRYCDYCGKKFIRVGKGWNSVWYCKECEEKQNKKISSEKTYKNLKRASYYADDRRKDYYIWGDEIFPWDNDGIYSHRNEIIEDAVALRELKRRVGTPSKRLRNIPWLSKLHSRIFEDYKEELENGEKDYSSYLANMSWLGIH